MTNFFFYYQYPDNSFKFAYVPTDIFIGITDILNPSPFKAEASCSASSLLSYIEKAL